MVNTVIYKMRHKVR